LKEKQDLEKKFQELLEKASGSLFTVADNSQALQEEKKVLQERLEEVQAQFFVLQEEVEKARASACKLEAELGETKRQLTDAKKAETFPV